MALTGNEISPTERRSNEQPASQPALGPSALNLPNLITVSRLVLAIVLFAMISYEGLWISAAVVFLVAAATDALDGYLARRYGQVTVLGRILDPFVDKIIICGAFIFLLAKRGVPDSGVTAWMVVIVVGREMFVTSLRAFLEQQGRDFSATFSGKLKMVVQCVAVTAALLSLSEHFRDVSAFRVFRDVTLWAAVAVTLYSGLVYVVRAASMLRSDAAG